MSNFIRNKIYRALDSSALESEMNEVMNIVEEYLAEAFYAGRDEYHTGCGDFEQTYPTFDDWYKEMEAINHEE
jgi:hypothetical protein